MTSIKNKKNTIPSITQDRIDNNIISRLPQISTEEKKVYAFLKGKESVQSLTIRIPKKLYSDFRKKAFDQNIKMNQIIVDLIKTYMQEKE